MKDQYGREIEYMRISVTDRCNLRCKYCIPECGVASVGHENILNFDEITKIVKECAQLGIKKVKITGGEPLVRRELHKLVASIKNTPGIEQVTLTTNGIFLKEQIATLAEAGIDAINISLDTLDSQKFKAITGFDALDKVMDAIELCKQYPEIKLKLNVVTLRDYNRDEIVDFAKLTKDDALDVRFIEMMPIGLGEGFDGYSQDYIKEILEEEYGLLEECQGKHGNGPAVYYCIQGHKGKIGFISAISHQFCDRCNRIRLTAEGMLKPCLQYAGGVDLKKAIREGDEPLENLIYKGIFEKPKEHNFRSSTIEDREQKLMSKIGG
ncbi:MAG: GTP 3',8-cyclase MoaA [Firmicutes bacterium]|nr:GTP 3',8-cyclase MoaA [Bacillota bacterium]